MSKNGAINTMKNSDLNKKKWIIVIFFLFYIKMSGTTYYQRNRNLNRAKDYCKNNKERLREQARNKCRQLSEEEKNIKRKYRRNRYHHMSEENKRLKEYQTNYRETKSSQFSN